MSMDIILMLGGAGLSLLNGILVHLLKTVNQRIRTLELSHFTKQEVRQLIDDKIGGLHSDIQDIKDKIDKLFDLYIEQHKK
jgi:hypothetical protein